MHENEMIEFLVKIIQKESVTPKECGIYAMVREILSDFKAISCDKNGVKNIFLYKDFSGDSVDSRDSTNAKDFTNAKIPADSTKSAESVESTRDFADSTHADSVDSTRDSATFATKPHLCFAGHIDVVPSGEGWAYAPFGGEIKDGILYGRGVCDMKGGIASFLYAIKGVKDFRGILSVLLTSDEEGDGEFGTKIMLEHLRGLGLLPHFAIVAEPTSAEILGDTIKIGRRGSINGILRIQGTQGHAAYPHKCVNPIDLIAPKLTKLSGVALDNGDSNFAPSRLVITDMRAGMELTNVTPAVLKIMFNVRNNPAISAEGVESYIAQVCENMPYSLELKISAKPFITRSQMLIEALSRAVCDKTGIMPRLDTGGGTSDARFFSEYGVSVVELGLKNATIHAVNECSSIEDIARLRDIFARFIEHFGAEIARK